MHMRFQTFRELLCVIRGLVQAFLASLGVTGGTITDEEVERTEDMTTGIPFTIFANVTSKRKVNLTDASGAPDTTSKISVKSSDPSQVGVELVPDEGGVPTRRYKVLTPTDGPSSATITITAPGFPGYTVVANVAPVVAGTISDEQDGEDEIDE